MTSKILIVKLAAIGDVVMAMPILSELHKTYKNPHITWICGKQVAPLLRASGMVDVLIEVNEKKLLKGHLFSKLYCLWKIWKKLIGKSFDLLLNLHADPRYKILSWPIFCSDRRHWEKGVNPLPGRYHADECVRLLDLKPETVSRNLVFPTLTLRTNLPFSTSKKPILVIAPGGAKNVLADDALRRWPCQNYAEVVNGLHKDYEIYITGSDTDEWVVPYFQSFPIHFMIGKLELLDLLALLEKCSLLITHDSGILHLGKLVHCPTLALFGPTNPNEKVSPRENITVLWGGANLSCRPCYNGKTYAQCQKNECLLAISPHQVIQEVKKILSSRSSY